MRFFTPWLTAARSHLCFFLCLCACFLSVVSCVDTWLIQKNTCPTCRSSIDSVQNHRAGAASATPPPNAAANNNNAAQQQQQPPPPQQQQQQSREQGQELVPVHLRSGGNADFERPPSPSQVAPHFEALSGGHDVEL
jgi:hypothetical protein